MAAPVAQPESWWAPVLRGLAAIVLGLVILIWPSFAMFSLNVLVILFGIYALVDGVFAIIAAVRAVGQGARWGTRLLEGIAGVGVGLLILFWPDLTISVVLLLIAVWAIVTGTFKIIAGIEGPQWLRLSSGIVSLLFGLLLILMRDQGFGAVLWLIGVFALVYGFLLLAESYQEYTGHGPSPTK